MASVSSASISSSSLSSPVKSGGSKERGAKQSDSSSLDESSSESEYTSKDEKNGSSESESDSDSESGASSKSSTETESETETTPEKGVAEQSPKSRKDNAPTLTRESPRTNTNADHDVAVSIQGGSRSKSSVGVKRSATSGSASSDSVPVAKHVQRKKTGAKKTEDAKSSGGGRVHLSPRSPAITPQAERIERSAGSAGSPDALDHVHAGIGSADGYEGDLVIPTPVEEDSAGRVPEMPPVTDEEIQITQLLLAKFTNVSLGLEPSPPITLHGGDSYVVNAWVDEVLNADRQLQKAVEKFKRVLKQAVQHKEVRTVLSEVLKNSPFMINDGKSTSRSSAFSGQNRKKATMHARKERIERKRMNEDRLLQAQEAREKKEKKGQKQRKKKTFDWADVPLEPEPLDMEDEAVSRPTPDRRQISGSSVSDKLKREFERTIEGITRLWKELKVPKVEQEAFSLAYFQHASYPNYVHLVSHLSRLKRSKLCAVEIIQLILEREELERLSGAKFTFTNDDEERSVDDGRADRSLDQQVSENRVRLRKKLSDYRFLFGWNNSFVYKSIDYMKIL